VITIRTPIHQLHTAIPCSKGRKAKTDRSRPIWTLARLFLFGLIAAMPVRAFAVEPERGQVSFLKRAVFAEGQLWVLSDAGDLSSIAEGQDTRVAETLPENASDLCVRDGHPLIITAGKGGSTWTLRQRINGTWSVATMIQTEGDGLLAMDCADRVTLLTTRRLIEIKGDRQSAVILSEKLSRGLVSSTYGTADQFFVGLNAGEWGGGLRRIDRRSGKITAVEHNSSGELCGGPLNTSCDPVNGITAEPWNPDCIVVVVGLVHFEPHGRVVEVCGNEVRRLYYKEYGQNRPTPRRKDDEPFSTVAFFGLTQKDDTLWAAGIDGIYNIGSDGTAHVVPLPSFKDIGGISISFDLPQFVLVLTEVNQRRSLSGAVPLLVPR
jgi:hypothetical protein